MRTHALVMLATLTGCAAPVTYTDFDLLDVNPASVTAGQEVGPADHLDHISAWYFGHSS